MKLVALHGFSLNGAAMRRQLESLQRTLPDADVVAPDAPNVCDDAAVDRLYAAWKVPRPPPPYRYWWNASDDGREYRGWDATRACLEGVLGSLAGERVGLIGFSQGAIVAAALAALAAHGELPPIAFTICIAGRPPRSDVLSPYLARPIATPSLHVWGEADALVGVAPRALVELFAPETREVATWPGGHVIPTQGATAEVMVDFIVRNS